jgi:hypothetical protein
VRGRDGSWASLVLGRKRPHNHTGILFLEISFSGHFHHSHTGSLAWTPIAVMATEKEKWLTKTFAASVFLGIGGFLYG